MFYDGVSNIEDSVNANTTGYAAILRQYGIPFSESERYLQVNRQQEKNGWVIFISISVWQIPGILRSILPVLMAENIAFKIVKWYVSAYYINMGKYGADRIGKIITAYPASDAGAQRLVELLAPITNSYKGPAVMNAIRVGEVLFAQYRETVTGEDGKKGFKTYLPERSRGLFPAGKGGIQQHKHKLIIGKYYLILSKIRVSLKGNIYKAISLKGMSFRLCVIKEGRLGMADDRYGRDITDRLLWQKDVMTDLYKKMPVPKVMDLFSSNDNNYLVMEYVRGTPLPTVIKPYYRNATWKTISVQEKEWILSVFCDILIIVEQLHGLGYVHRDIKSRNFLLQPNRKPYLLDFELSYSIRKQLPVPPFTIKTAGYVAPEQFADYIPTAKEDIFSLGALLVFLVTGTEPRKFLMQESGSIEKGLELSDVDMKMIALILLCMEKQADKRPTLAGIRAMIDSYLTTFK